MIFKKGYLNSLTEKKELIKKCDKEVCYKKIICIFVVRMPIGPNGGIGRRTGFKIQRSNIRAGSIPALGTERAS